MFYIPLDLLKKHFNCSSDQELLDKREIFRSQIQPEDLDFIRKELNNPQVNYAHILYHIDALQNDSCVVFHQWINQSQNLKNILLNKELKPCDFRQQIVAEHFLFPDFRKFVSPFLSNALLTRLQSNSVETYMLAASYLSLLSDADQNLVQQQVEKMLNETWQTLQTKLKPNLPEKEVIRLFATYFSDEQVKLLNYLTKSFYYLRINWINEAVEQLSYGGTTYRIAYWLVNQLKKLDLNPEHQAQIKEIADSIRTGDGRYFRKKSMLDSSNNQWRTIGMLLFFLALFGGIFLVGKSSNWFGKTQEDDSKTSFEQFTVEERMQIDSLVKTMEQRKPNEPNQPDPSMQNLHMTPVMLPIVDRTHFENKKVQVFVDDCFKALKLVEAGRIDSCVPYSEKEMKNLRFSGFKNLIQNKGSLKVFFRNASEYQLLVLLFDDTQHAAVYARLFAPEDELSFEANAGQRVLILPGTNLGHFRTSAAKTDQPSAAYHHHFCFVDENFEHRLSAAYTVKQIAGNTCKLMANQSAQGEFYLVDIDEVLEE